jgi:uncharacterized spore protein YtfJ
MSTNIEQKSNLAERRETFLERLADKVGNNVRASVVFGERVERDGVTVIPVAKARWGFGGGSGTNPQVEGQEGTGGGAGVSVSPVGYIVVKEGKAHFRPIYDPRMIVPIIASLGIVTMLVLRGVRLLVRS